MMVYYDFLSTKWLQTVIINVLKRNIWLQMTIKRRMAGDLHAAMKKFLRILFGLVLIGVGLGCFFYPDIREWRTQREVDRIVEQFEENFEVPEEAEDAPPAEEEPSGEKTETEAAPEVSGTPDASSESDDSEKESETDDRNKETFFPELYQELQNYNLGLIKNGQNITDAWSYSQPPIDLSYMPDGAATIGYIDIPDMDVRLPLFLGASEENLEHGAAVLSETSMPIGGENTNCVIAAHRGWNGSAYFQYIENLEEGSDVYITNPWETLVYRVVGTKIIDPYDTSSVFIQPGKDMVTLLTCHPYVLGGGPYRYLAYCERVGTEDRDSSIEIKNPSVEEPPVQAEETEIQEEPDDGGTVISNADIESNDDASSVVVSDQMSEFSALLLFLEKKLRVVLLIVLLICALALIFRRRKQK